MDDYQREPHIEAEVWAPPFVTFEELAPFLDGLTDHFGSVRAGRRMPPHMTGSVVGPEMIETIIVGLAALGSAEFVRRFAGLMAEDTYKASRNWLLGFRKASDRTSGPTQMFIIQVGSHRFLFDQTIADEEFQHQLVEAQRELDRSPADLLERTEMPVDAYEPIYWRWHEQSGQWKSDRTRVDGTTNEEMEG